MQSSSHRGPIRNLAALVLCAGLVAAACGSEADSPAPGVGDETSSVDAPVETEPPSTDEAAESTVPSSTDQSSEAESSDDSSIDDSATEADDRATDGVLAVPAEFDTVQAAVDAASPGDLVLVAPGTYHEAVDVVTDEITIRGLDRDGVVFDGELQLDNGIRVLGAHGVSVENLTTVNYTNNGVFWISSNGYRASYITTHRTGDYGIYAFDSVGGLIDNSHTVGSKDAGVYIGQCYPCDAVVDNVVSEHNGLGYSGTDSGGNLLIVNSVFRNNRAGLVPNSGSYELCYPERETTIVGNLVYSNNQDDTPAINDALLAQRNGIVIAGGVRNTVERNLVYDHLRTGIALTPYLEETPNDDLPTREEWDLPCAEQKLETPVIPEGQLLWDPFDNRIVGNVIFESGLADIGVGTAGSDPSTLGNCWSDNEITTSRPADLQALAPCDGEGSGGDWTVDPLDVVSWIGEMQTLPGNVDWQTAPLPDLGEHENMPDAATAPARPATDVPPRIDLDAIAVPDAPTG